MYLKHEKVYELILKLDSICTSSFDTFTFAAKDHEEAMKVSLYLVGKTEGKYRISSLKEIKEDILIIER